MQTASVPGFVRTILIIVGIYYAFKIVARFLMPIVLRKMVQKAEQQFNQSTHHTQSSNQQKTQSTSSKFEKPKTKKQVGEYIDYEEVD